MKILPRLALLCTLTVLATAVIPSARAAMFTWDPSASASVTAAGNGTWDTSTALWYNGTSDVAWPGAGNSVLFADTNPTGSAYTVTVQSGGVTVGGIEFQNSPSASTFATLTGGTITLSNGGSGVLIKNSAAGSGSGAIISTVLTGSENVTFTANSNLQLATSATYTGTTTVTSGNLRLTTNNALPTGTALTLSGGSILLQGANIGLTVASLASTNTSNKISANIAGTSTLTINGSTSTSFSGLLSASTGTLALVKAGTGTLTLKHANTYTGTTTITSGTLTMGVSNVFAVTNFSLGGGTLALGTFTNTTVGTLALTANSTLTLGSGGAFAFADSSALGWGANTLSITGTFIDGSSIRFGTTSSALTTNQLALISINGSAASINSSGFLVTASAIPEPSTYAVLAGLAVLGLVTFRRRTRSRC